MKINVKKVKQYIPITFMGICVLVFLIFSAINEDFSISSFLEMTRGKPLVILNDESHKAINFIVAISPLNFAVTLTPQRVRQGPISKLFQSLGRAGKTSI